MIAPRYGPPCSCHRCTVAGVAGRKTIEIRPGEFLHGRELARHYEAYRKWQEELQRFMARKF